MSRRDRHKKVSDRIISVLIVPQSRLLQEVYCNYNNLGDEQLWVDVICVHPWIHKWILHGILSGFKRPSQQKNYPNLAQRTEHFWCCQPVLVRGALALALLVNLVKLAY